MRADWTREFALHNQSKDKCQYTEEKIYRAVTVLITKTFDCIKLDHLKRFHRRGFIFLRVFPFLTIFMIDSSEHSTNRDDCSPVDLNK